MTNTTETPKDRYLVKVDGPGTWREVLNTDSSAYGGSNVGNAGSVTARAATDAERAQLGGDARYVLELTLPPLGAVALKLDAPPTAKS
jgi:1,4-alpha-glucan branching enzyme